MNQDDQSNLQFLNQMNIQVSVIIVMSSIMLFLRNISNRYPLSLNVVSLINLFLIYTQVLLLIKINAADGLTGGTDTNLPWWFYICWYTVLYTFLCFVIVYIIDITIMKEINELVRFIKNKYCSYNVDTDLDLNNDPTYIIGLAFFGKIIYVLAYIIVTIISVTICDPGTC